MQLVLEKPQSPLSWRMEELEEVGLDNVGVLGCGSSQGYAVSLAVTTRKVAEEGLLGAMVTHFLEEVLAVTSTGDAGVMPILEDGLGPL